MKWRTVVTLTVLSALALSQPGARATSAGGTVTLRAFGTTSATWQVTRTITWDRLSYLAQGGLNPFTVVKGDLAGFRISDARGHTRLAMLITRASGLVPATFSGSSLEPGKYLVTMITPGGGTEVTLPIKGQDHITITTRTRSKATGGITYFRADLPALEAYSATQALPGKGFVLAAVSIREHSGHPADTTSGDICILPRGSQSSCWVENYPGGGGSFQAADTGGGNSYFRYFLRSDGAGMKADGALEIRCGFLGTHDLERAVITSIWTP